MTKSGGRGRTRRDRAPRIGLVLGAGGITGFAFHSGTLSAVERLTGWDPRTADVIVGTSAGSGFGAMLRGGVPVDEVIAHLLAAPTNPETMARLRVLSGREFNAPSWMWFGPSSPRLLLDEIRRPWRLRPGRLAISLLPSGRIPTEFLGDRVRQLHGLDWPDETLWVCALRLSDGERVVFGADQVDVDVGTAVEASSAIPSFFRPVWIDGERHVDGAIHSPTNADLLTDHDLDLIVVLSPMSGECRTSMRRIDGLSRLSSANALNREVEELQATGTQLLVIEPGPGVVRTMGSISMDPTRMVPTVLQSSAATLELLSHADHAAALEVLGRASEASTSPPNVPYPVDSTKRVS